MGAGVQPDLKGTVELKLPLHEHGTEAEGVCFNMISMQRWVGEGGFALI